MKKYIDADHLKAEIEKRKKSLRVGICGEAFTRKQKIEMLVASEELDRFNRIIDSLQQDKETLELCSKIWWEEQGWIMIPPNATIKGIDSLLKQVRKNLQQEQPEVDLKKEYKEYVEDDPVFSKLTNRNVGLAIARHFYELGLKAKEG